MINCLFSEKTCMTKRYLLPTIGSAGDVHPVIGLALALKTRGHNVTVLTNGYFGPLVRQMGLDFMETGAVEAYQSAVANPLLWHPTKGFEFIARNFLLPQMRVIYHLLSGFNPAETVVIAPGLAFGARLAQEKLGLPLITAHLQATMIRSVHEPPVMGPMALPARTPLALKQNWFRFMDNRVIDPILLPELNKFRQELGLPPVKHVFKEWLQSPQKIIGLWPGWYAPRQPDWPPQVTLTGFLQFERDSEQGVPGNVQAFLAQGEAPLVFTPGSAHQHGAQFFQAAVEACGALGRRGLLASAHAEHIPADLPESICYTPYLPFSQVLPQAAALVFHGGMGTAAQGLAAGIPLLVMPMSHDQPDNAARLKRLGVADALPPKKFTGTAVSAKLDRLLHDPQIFAACRKYAALVDFDQALADTCAVIENFDA
jgi:rhamnosyltransferase subunit B